MVLGVVVLVVAVLALRNPQHGGAVAGTDTRTVTIGPSESLPASLIPSGSVSIVTRSVAPSSTTPTSSFPPGVGAFPLIILNDTVKPHLARQAAHRFQAAGWTVTSIDERYSNQIVSTVAYYDPSVKGAKHAAMALQKQFPTIKRVVPRFSQLPAGPIVVVLTTDYSPS